MSKLFSTMSLWHVKKNTRFYTPLLSLTLWQEISIDLILSFVHLVQYDIILVFVREEDGYEGHMLQSPCMRSILAITFMFVRAMIVKAFPGVKIE